MWGIPYLICVFLFFTADSLAAAASPYAELGMGWSGWHRYLAAVVVAVYLLSLKLLRKKIVAVYWRNLVAVIVALSAGMVPLAQMWSTTNKLTLGNYLLDPPEVPFTTMKNIRERVGYGVVSRPVEGVHTEIYFPKDKDINKMREVLVALGLKVLN